MGKRANKFEARSISAYNKKANDYENSCPLRADGFLPWRISKVPKLPKLTALPRRDKLVYVGHYIFIPKGMQHIIE